MAFGAGAFLRIEQAVGRIFALQILRDFSTEEATGDGMIGIAAQSGGAAIFDVDEQAAGVGAIESADGVLNLFRTVAGWHVRRITIEACGRAILGAMRVAAVVIQNAVRVLGLILLLLGFLFWSGHSLRFVPVHMRIGEVLIGLLWILAGIGLRKGVPPGLVLGGMFYGVIVLAFAFRMGSFLPGEAHEIIRVVHLLLGLGAIGMVEMISGRIKRAAVA